LKGIRTVLTVRRFSSETRRGFTLIELVVVVMIVGLLAALAVPNFQRVLERARIVKAVGDISVIGQNINEYFLTNDAYPASLVDIGMGAYSDPWGKPYVYMVIAGAKKGQLRKDKFLVPINSDYDLYSMGADGESKPPLNAAASKDDIIRANDGGFVGLAEAF
jgi:general secretion pathway protein G